MPKLYWRIKNVLEYLYFNTLKSGYGLLSHKKDDRDIPFGSSFSFNPSFFDFSLDTGHRFNQKRFNICVFASRVQGISMQEGMLFSTRWDVKLARKNGWITGNGWSFLRAENDIGYKFGRLPIEYMDDEIRDGMSFDEYSRWTPEDDALLPIAAKFKTSQYSVIYNRGQAIQALESGLVLFTAGRWFSGMNHPFAPKFLLLPTGSYIGGHAYISTGYSDRGMIFENPQTFGYLYANGGKAWIPDLFSNNQFDVYVENPLDISVKLEYLDGKYVKASGADIYQVMGNQKRYVTEDEFTQNPSPFVTLSDKFFNSIPNV